MVNVINRSMFPVQTSMNLISKMQGRFAQLQVQLATGQRASNLAEMGTDRFVTLSMTSRISRIEGYQQSIDMVNMRLDVFDQIIGRLDKVESNARAAISPSAYGSSNVNFGTAPALARSQLDEVINLLNTDVDGRYLFAGGSVDKRPVEAIGAMLDGANGKAGYVQVAAERLAADKGNGLGRLNLSVAADTVSLAEDDAHVFGFKLSTLSATGSGMTLTQPSGADPDSLSIAVTTQPIEGDTVTINLTLPDQTQTSVTLKAVTGTPGAGEYQIGGTTGQTALNLSAALQTKLTEVADTELTVASNYAAADNFFNAQGDPVLRVVGTPATATALAAADPTTTIMWYKGQDSANARTTVTAKVDDAATVNYGAQANESGPLALIRSLAVLATQSFTNADATSTGRFDAVATRNYSRLSEVHNNENGSIEMLAVELGNAKVNVEGVASRQSSYKAQLQGMVDDISSVPKEEVAMEMLALQTRLQASYEATSLIASLSLVNYIK